jgi:hypothetical protein
MHSLFNFFLYFYIILFKWSVQRDNCAVGASYYHIIAIRHCH